MFTYLNWQQFREIWNRKIGWKFGNQKIIKDEKQKSKTNLREEGLNFKSSSFYMKNVVAKRIPFSYEAEEEKQ